MAGRARRNARLLLVALVAASSAVGAGCSQFSATGLQFRHDDSIEFTGPPERSSVAVPFDLAWSDTARPAGSRYAVVINQTPMPPGEDLAWFTRDDEVCKRTAGCPTLDDLRLRGVIVTDVATAEVLVVPSVIGGRQTPDDEFTVIRLDADGVRISEAAFVWTLDVEARPGL